MEFTNEISFDRELVKGQESKIKYNGYLARNGASSVTLVYGYDSDWKDTDSTPMVKVEKGFELALKIKPFEEFNFCFRDENNNWDNNYGNNFNAKINAENAVEQVVEAALDEAPVEEANVNIEEIKKIETEISNLFNELFNTEEKEEENVQYAAAPEDIQTPAFGEQPEINVKEFNLDELIDQILTPILNNNVTTPVYVPVDEVKTSEDFTTVEDVNALVENILNNEPDKELNIDIDQYDDMVKNLGQDTELIANEDLSQEEIANIANTGVVPTINEIVSEEVEVKPAKITKKDFTVIEEEKQELEEEISLIESQIAEEEDKKQEELSLTLTDDDTDLVAPRKLSSIYKFIKRIRLAIAKLFYGKFGSKQEE